MSNKWSEHLKDSAPVNNKPWSTVLLCIAVVALILAIFEPFAFRLNSLCQFFMLLGFVLLVFITSALFLVIFPRIFRSYFAPERWTNGRMYMYILSFLLFTGLGVFVYEYILLGGHSADDFWEKDFFHIFMVDMVAAITIGLIPVSISIYITKNRDLKKNLHDAIQLNNKLSRKIKEISTGSIHLEGATKESISLHPNSILYIEADGNYVNIVYCEDNILKKKKLRSTIKQIEEKIREQAHFIRCHRAFIININQVNDITGNAQGYKLTLNHTNEKIPVSRTYINVLIESLK